MTMTTDPVDLWRNHQARYEILPDAIDKGFDKAAVDLTPLQKHSVDTFVTTLSDLVSEAMSADRTVEEWAQETTKSLIQGWPVLALFLAANTLDSLAAPGQEAKPYGILGQALQRVIDTLTPIVEHDEAHVFKQLSEW